MAEQVKKIVKHNKLEKQIQVLTGLIENTVVPEPVDVLISEWMGYMLIYISFLYFTTLKPNIFTFSFTNLRIHA